MIHMFYLVIALHGGGSAVIPQPDLKACEAASISLPTHRPIYATFCVKGIIR